MGTSQQQYHGPMTLGQNEFINDGGNKEVFNQFPLK